MRTGVLRRCTECDRAIVQSIYPRRGDNRCELHRDFTQKELAALEELHLWLTAVLNHEVLFTGRDAGGDPAQPWEGIRVD